MRLFSRKHYRWLRHLPRKRHLRNSWVHRLMGERLFIRELWSPTRKGVAGGLALGLLIGFTPTMGAQVILCSVMAYVLRLNVPIALAGTLVTNPFTAALVYPLEYQFGVWLTGVPSASELDGYGGTLRTFVRYAKPLWIGSLVIGAAAAALAYGLVMLLWKEAEHLRVALRKSSPGNDTDSQKAPESRPAPKLVPNKHKL